MNGLPPLEESTRALQNYLTFAESHLLIPAPVRIEIGLVGIAGYGIAVSENVIAGNALRDTIQWQGEADYKTPAWEILAPFFKRMWEHCGVQRTPNAQRELLAQFSRAAR
jgi:hypothetical protein